METQQIGNTRGTAEFMSRVARRLRDEGETDLARKVDAKDIVVPLAHGSTCSECGMTMFRKEIQIATGPPLREDEQERLLRAIIDQMNEQQMLKTGWVPYQDGSIELYIALAHMQGFGGRSTADVARAGLAQFERWASEVAAGPDAGGDEDPQEFEPGDEEPSLEEIRDRLTAAYEAREREEWAGRWVEDFMRLIEQKLDQKAAGRWGIVFAACRKELRELALLLAELEWELTSDEPKTA